MVPQLPGDPGLAQLAGAPGMGDMGGMGGMGGMGNSFAGGLLKPATDLLGTLGNGVFQGMNPQEMFGGVSQAFQQGASGLQQAMGSMMGSGGPGWAGAGARSAAAKTGETLANGAAVGAQGTTLGGQYSAAAADVAQGHTRLLETIQQGQDELAALSGGLPWTAANMVESASRTTARATAIVTELESSLTSQAAATTATGAPVAVTEAPQMAMGAMGPLMSVGMGMMGPAMAAGSMPLSMGMRAAMTGMQAGMQAGTGLMSQASQAGAHGAAAAAPAAAAMPARLAGAASHAGGLGGGAGGGPVATQAARAVPSSPLVQNETNAAAATRSVAVRPATGGAGMGGAGMMGAGAGKAGASRGGNHTTASFLHTTGHGDQIVGDTGTAAPPVLGEADPNAADNDVKVRVD